MGKHNYSRTVEKFIDNLKNRELQKENEFYSTEDVLNEALNDTHINPYSHLAFIVLYYIVIIIYFLINKSNLQGLSVIYLPVVFIITPILIYLKLGLMPRLDYLKKLKRKIKQLPYRIKNAERLDYEYIRKFLFSNESVKIFENRELLKEYFESNINNLDGRIIQEDSNNFQRLLCMFYIFQKKLKLPTTDREMAYLLGSLVYAKPKEIQRGKISWLNKYNRINEDFKIKDYEKMRIELKKVQKIMKDSLNIVDRDIQLIDNYLKRNKENK